MDYLLQESFFDPLTINDSETPFGPLKYKSIVQEQVYLSYITKGGVSYSDSEKMTPYERKVAVDFMVDLMDKQSKAIEEAKNNSGKGGKNIKLGS